MRSFNRAFTSIGLAIVVLLTSSSSINEVAAADRKSLRNTRKKSNERSTRSLPVADQDGDADANADVDVDVKPNWVKPDDIEDSSSPNSGDGNDNHRYMIKYKADSKEYQLRLANARRKMSESDSSNGMIDVMFIPQENIEVVNFQSEAEAEEWRERSDVVEIEKDSKVYLTAESTPYGINLVRAPTVPDTYVSNRKVCIIDSGYDINHQDLPKGDTVTGTNGGNAGPWNQDGDGHGTHVAGTIAAISGNENGVVGVMRNGEVQLHIVRVFGNDGNYAWTSGLVGAVNECVAVGANVVNMSLGSPNYSNFEADSYTRITEQRNVLLVASAGNEGNEEFWYPASYDSVLSVAAVNWSSNHANFSQRNSQVDIAAPGVKVLSTLPGNRYAEYSGTSMAAPHVSGVAALIWSYFPSKTAVEVREALTSTAKDLGDPGRDNKYGYGLVQADAAFIGLGGQFPTSSPSNSPVASPSRSPSKIPTTSPSNRPSLSPSKTPSLSPSLSPSTTPTDYPSMVPTNEPTIPGAPTRKPTNTPTIPITESPSNNPSSSPTSCHDFPRNWHDAFGPNFNCEYYETSGECAEYGDLVGLHDMTANQACCVCGGGTFNPSLTLTPTKSPTDYPTKSPEESSIQSSCVDDPPGWHEDASIFYDCEFYRFPGECNAYGASFTGVNNKTANEACCACGGGIFS